MTDQIRVYAKGALSRKVSFLECSAKTEDKPRRDRIGPDGSDPVCASGRCPLHARPRPPFSSTCQQIPAVTNPDMVSTAESQSRKSFGSHCSKSERRRAEQPCHTFNEDVQYNRIVDILRLQSGDVLRIDK